MLDIILGTLGVINWGLQFRPSARPNAHSHHPLPVWVLFTLFGLVAVYLQYRAWLDIFKAPLSDVHTQDLRVMARNVEGSLGSPRIVYRTANRADSYVHEMFRDHFKDLAPLLDRWDAVADEEDTARAILRQWIREDAGKRFPFDSTTQKGWWPGAVGKCAADDVERSFAVEQMPAANLAWAYDAIVWGQTVIRQFADRTDEAPPEAEAMMEEVREWTAEVGKSDLRAAVTGLLHERNELHKRIGKAVQPLLSSERLWGRCDACRPSRRSAFYRKAVEV